MKHEFQGLLLAIFSIGFLIDVFFLPSTFDYGSDIRLLLLVLFWLFIIKISQFTSTATFKMTLAFLAVLSVLFIFFPTSVFLERVASWVYIYLVIGVIQQFFESRKESSVKDA